VNLVLELDHVGLQQAVRGLFRHVYVRGYVRV